MIPLARVAVLRLVRDRTNLFFVLVFPLLLVLLIGATFGGGVVQQVGVVQGQPLSGAVADAVDEASGVVPLDDRADAEAAVEEGRVEFAVVPTDRGATVLARPGRDASGVTAVVDRAVRTATVPLRQAEALAAAGATGAVPPAPPGDVGVRVREVGQDELAEEFAGLGRFDLGASQQLLLFVFITSLTSSTAVVQARRWRVLDRVLTGPTSAGRVVAGLGAGQFLVALLQGVLIVGGSALLFDVAWGSLLATGSVVLVFSLVSAAAGLLLGAVVDNEEQAGGLSVPIALGLAAIGGSMLPLELFPDALRTASRLTPHAWGNEALAEIVRRDGAVADVATELGVLSLFAVVLGGAAALVLRRRLAG